MLLLCICHGLRALTHEERWSLFSRAATIADLTGEEAFAAWGKIDEEMTEAMGPEASASSSASVCMELPGLTYAALSPALCVVAVVAQQSWGDVVGDAVA